MKATKTFGLAALAALMAMGFVGASSGMAETIELCGHDGTPCEAIHHVHEASVGKAKLLTSLGTTQCNVLFLGDVKSYGFVGAVISGNFTYSTCELGGSSCTVTEENGPAEIEVEGAVPEMANVSEKGLFRLKCGSIINCAYTYTTTVALDSGPLFSNQQNGEVTISTLPITKEAGSGFICPKTANLDITTTPLSATTIENYGLGYCVETEHKTGLYIDDTCKILGNSQAKEEQKHEWTYALVFEKEGKKVGEVLCYGTLLAYGLWEARDSLTGKCLNDNNNNTSLYENGTIELVE